MEPIRKFTASLVAIPINDIDTDQIIPARFLKTVDKVGLGAQCFSDWRYNADGSLKADFVLNRTEYQGAGVLVAGNNFGCGSSREHAPWALMGAGFSAVVSTEFADIFSNNALKNGLLPIVVDEATQQQLVSLAEEDPTATVAVDLESQTLVFPDGRSVTFPIDGFSKHCLLQGIDQLDFLMGLEADVVGYETSRSARVNTVE